MNFNISTDKSKFDLHVIHDYLSNHSYWAKDRAFETVQKSIENSLCFGMFDKSDNLIGFARVLTDFTVFAYLMDVFILENFRKQGLGKELMDFIMNYPDLQKVKTIMLATQNAHGLYKKYGFKLTENANKIMVLTRNFE